MDNFIIQTLTREFRPFYENLSNLSLNNKRFASIEFLLKFLLEFDEIRKNYEGV